MSKNSLEERAQALHQEAASNMAAINVSFVKLGEILKEIRDDELYRYIEHHNEKRTYESLNEYLQSPQIGISPTRASTLIGIAEVLIPAAQRTAISVAEVSEVGVGKLGIILPFVRKAVENENYELVEYAIRKAQESTQHELIAEFCKPRQRKAIGSTVVAILSESDGNVTITTTLSKRQWAKFCKYLQPQILRPVVQQVA